MDSLALIQKEATMPRINKNTKDRARTHALIVKMFTRAGFDKESAMMFADEHICRTTLAPSHADYVETVAPMATYAPARAFIQAVIAQMADQVSEGVAFFDATAREGVAFDVRTKRDTQLARIFADVVATRARFESVATMAEFLRAGGVIILRNAQHSQSAYNFVTMRADGALVNVMLYASGGHTNGAGMILAPMTVHSGDDADVVAHIVEEVKVLGLRACGCPIEWRDPLGTLTALTKRGMATGARDVARGMLKRMAGEVTPANDVRLTIAHRWDVSGIWNDADDVADWADFPREVKRGHEGTL